MSRRQAFKAALLEQHYQAPVYAALAARLAYVQRNADHIAITLRDGAGRIEDRGDRMTVSGRNVVNDDAIRSLVDLAKVRGWKSITPTGSPEFRERLAAVAVAAGLNVKPSEPSTPTPTQPTTDEERQAEVVRQERERLARARANFGYANTPKPR